MSPQHKRAPKCYRAQLTGADGWQGYLGGRVASWKQLWWTRSGRGRQPAVTRALRGVGAPWRHMSRTVPWTVIEMGVHWKEGLICQRGQRWPLKEGWQRQREQEMPRDLWLIPYLKVHRRHSLGTLRNTQQGWGSETHEDQRNTDYFHPVLINHEIN